MWRWSRDTNGSSRQLTSGQLGGTKHTYSLHTAPSVQRWRWRQRAGGCRLHPPALLSLLTIAAFATSQHHNIITQQQQQHHIVITHFVSLFSQAIYNLVWRIHCVTYHQGLDITIQVTMCHKSYLAYQT